MKDKCAKCGTELDTNKGQILVYYPVFFKGQWLVYPLCRPHFIDGDALNSREFGKWVNKKVEK